jgi:hypothetical protein
MLSMDTGGLMLLLGVQLADCEPGRRSSAIHRCYIGVSVTIVPVLMSKTPS